MMDAEVERWLKLPAEEREEQAEGMFRRLAIFIPEKLARRYVI